MFNDNITHCTIGRMGVNLYQFLQFMLSLRNVAADESTILDTGPSSSTIIFSVVRYNCVVFDGCLARKGYREEVYKPILFFSTLSGEENDLVAIWNGTYYQQLQSIWWACVTVVKYFVTWKLILTNVWSKLLMYTVRTQRTEANNYPFLSYLFPLKMMPPQLKVI